MTTNTHQPHTDGTEIALLCQDFYPETISTGLFMTELAVKLSHAGHRLRVYCTRPVYRDETQNGSVPPPYLEYEGIKIFRVPAWGNPHRSLLHRTIFSLTYVLAVMWAIFRDRGLFKGMIVTTSPPFIGIAAWLLSKITQIPYITIVYDVYPDVVVRLKLLSPHSILAHLWEQFSRLILRASKNIVVIGRDMVQPVQEKLSPDTPIDLTLIPNWANEERIKPIPKADNPFIKQHNLQDRFVVQYAGRMGRVHNLQPLLKAAQQLQDLPVCFQFIGAGAQHLALEQQAKHLNLRNVQFLPYQPLSKLSAVLSAADVGVVSLSAPFTGLSVPSKSYGLMASGTPILALLEPESEVGQVVRETQCGWVLTDPSGGELAKFIRHLMDNPTELAAAGQRGRTAFLQAYTLDRAANDYLDVLKQSFSTNGHGHPTRERVM